MIQNHYRVFPTHALYSGVANALVKEANDKHLLPPGYTFVPSGMNEMMNEAIADFGEAIVLGGFLTLLLLSAILESWSRPGIVLLTLPMGLIGVFASLVMTHLAITILVLLGVLMLIGVVVNAAILIIDRMAQFIAEGKSKREALIEAVADEFRPVLMVVLASGLGMLPIAISTGVGSENRVGIGVASVGAIIVAGLFTITVLPVIALLFTPKEKK